MFAWQEQYLKPPFTLSACVVLKFYHGGSGRRGEWLYLAQGGEIGLLRITRFLPQLLFASTFVFIF